MHTMFLVTRDVVSYVLKHNTVVRSIKQLSNTNGKRVPELDIDLRAHRVGCEEISGVIMVYCAKNEVAYCRNGRNARDSQ